MVAEYATSGLSQKQFVAKHDVTLSTFQYWLYKRSKLESNIDVNTRPRFLPVEVVASPAPQAPVGGERLRLEVVMRSGVVLRFETGTDVLYLSELCVALG